eukprot:1138052-Pelagomonas_calceolata.AAC.8
MAASGRKALITTHVSACPPALKQACQLQTGQSICLCWKVHLCKPALTPALTPANLTPATLAPPPSSTRTYTHTHTAPCRTACQAG